VDDVGNVILPSSLAFLGRAGQAALDAL